MSWSYSPALVAAFLEANFSDTEQSQPLSTTPTPDQFYSHGKPTEFSRLSRFGMTCEPLTESHGEELLMWYLAGFHARTYPLQEKAQGLTESDQDSGEKWRGWLAKFDPDSCSWKTAQRSLLGDSEWCSVILPRSGMIRGGLLLELPMLERRTSETGCGYWPTPTVCGNYNRKGASKTSGDGLATAVRTWPTPQASDNRNRGTTQTPAIARRIEAGKQVMLSMCMDGPLNPDWVEWLMGWPIGHTALKPSETDKSHSAAPPHGKPLAAPLLEVLG